jgi:hypothetical protein
MANKLVVIINSLKVPKIKKILLYEMKFLVPNYSFLQIRGLPLPDPRSVCPLSSTEFVEPPPPPKKKNCWVHHWTHLKTVINQKVRSTCPQNKQGPQQLPCILMLKSCAMIIKLKCFWSHLVDYTKSACIGTWKHSYWATTPARGQNMPWTWSSHYLFHSTVVKNILKTVLLLTCNNIITWV